MYRLSSPAQSTTSLSDNDDDDANKSTFFASPEPFAVSPAQWSSRLQLLPHANNPPKSQSARLPPEILIHILKYLHSTKDLYSALLVSRTWCQCSVELLWHRPSFSKLSTLIKMMRILSRQDQTFSYAHFIRRLNFVYLGGDLTDSLFVRLTQCVRLERLTLINCGSLADNVLERVLPSFPNLVALDLTGVTEASDKAIIALASAAKRLQGINLCGCKKLTDEGILALAANCPLLRRVKLSNCELITDAPVSALAKSCPLLLEIDLHNCKNITDVSIRDLWLHSRNMREMRLSHCGELSDAAFPAPPRPELVSITGPRPFPLSTAIMMESLPPLRVSGPFEHLRMLDLTGCSALTDDAVEGIIAVAPKIRNLCLAKCSLLTDNAVENICKLGKHIHHLHLGHASSITDRSVKNLARSCTRLRYIDFANCAQLTDMSVFELSNLQKLRRIGLVRVSNLTDHAIYALAERHASLERIHLSYCDQITVAAIHFLLQKLQKLTHLSLTGVPAFRRQELQRFCRSPPKEFNSTQRAAFCVYSGKGVSDLRTFLIDLYNSYNPSADDASNANDTDYDEFDDDFRARYLEVMDTAEDGDEDSSQTGHRAPSGTGPGAPPAIWTPYYQSQQSPSPPSTEATIIRDRTHPPIPRPTAPGPSNWNGPSVVTIVPAQRRGFGQPPIIEASSSSAPDDAASSRSTNTNQSNGGGFFRSYTGEAGPPRPDVITPDLVYAEIGHGRGIVPEAGPSTVLVQSQPRLNGDGSSGRNVYGVGSVAIAVPGVIQPQHRSRTVLDTTLTTAAHALRRADARGSTSRSRVSEHDTTSEGSSTLHQRPAGRNQLPEGWSTAPYISATRSRSRSTSPTTRELHDSVESALGGHATMEGREVDARGRSARRSLRSTLSAAEQYASTFLFGAPRSSSGHEGNAGPSNRDGDAHGY